MTMKFENIKGKYDILVHNIQDNIIKIVHTETDFVSLEDTRYTELLKQYTDSFIKQYICETFELSIKWQSEFKVDIYNVVKKKERGWVYNTTSSVNELLYQIKLVEVLETLENISQDKQEICTQTEEMESESDTESDTDTDSIESLIPFRDFKLPLPQSNYQSHDYKETVLTVPERRESLPELGYVISSGITEPIDTTKQFFEKHFSTCKKCDLYCNPLFCENKKVNLPKDNKKREYYDIESLEVFDPLYNCENKIPFKDVFLSELTQKLGYDNYGLTSSLRNII